MGGRLPSCSAATRLERPTKSSSRSSVSIGSLIATVYPTAVCGRWTCYGALLKDQLNQTIPCVGITLSPGCSRYSNFAPKQLPHLSEWLGEGRIRRQSVYSSHTHNLLMVNNLFLRPNFGSFDWHDLHCKSHRTAGTKVIEQGQICRHELGWSRARQ
jgi:hypothetical protein